MNKLMCLIALVAICVMSNVKAEGVSMAEFEAMKKEMLDMRKEMKGLKSPDEVVSAVDAAAAPAAGGEAVKTGAGKLTMGGLVQVWYSAFRHDRRGLFDAPATTGIFDTNAHADNDGFRAKTVELYFDMAITDKVSAFVYINPAASSNSFFPQSAVGQKTLANVAPAFNAVNGPFTYASTGQVAAVQTGGGANAGNLLQDSLINFHGIVPHHDFTVGQMLNTFNEENFASNAELDFVERSYIGNSVPRDLGAVIHGSWWGNGGGGSYVGAGDSGRFQYWVGAWNGSGNLHGTAGGSLNRSDDNNEKDFVGTVLLRPVWNDCFGKLELGYSFRTGIHGEGGNGLQATGPVNSLDRKSTWSMGHDGWAKYWFPRALKGLWVKGEMLWQKDRNAPGSVIDLANADLQLGDGAGNADQAQPFKTFGYWGSIGYKLSDSPLFCPSSTCWVKNFEFDFRFESAPNVFIANPADARRTLVYDTKVYTAGINYYIKGSNAKIQANYNNVR